VLVAAAAGHAVVLDVQRLELYCRECRDYVYLQQFDDAVVVSASGRRAQATLLQVMLAVML
jgi:hypothetical protein